VIGPFARITTFDNSAPKVKGKRQGQRKDRIVLGLVVL